MLPGMHTGRGKDVKPVEIGVVITMGLLVGLMVGYVLMGTAHAIMEIGFEEHYKHSG
jgi:hypothetical protein